MNSAEYRKWNIGQHLAMAFLCPTLLLLLNAVCLAQTTISATPNSVVDAAKPQPIVLTIKKTADGTIDTAFAGQVAKVKVGGQDVSLLRDVPAQGIITITPPVNLSGPQLVQLLDSADKSLGEVQLQYPNPSPSPTPDRAEARRDKLADSPAFYISNGLMFVLMLGVFIYVIARGILRSRATFRNLLGLPVGSFRAIIAFTLVGYLGFYILTGILSISAFAPPDFLLGIVATVVGFYFGSRGGEEGAVDERAGIVRGIVRQDTKPVSGALVKFKRDDGTEPYSRLTDVDGRFVLQGVKPGKYTVSATVTGSTASAPLELTITEGSDREVEIIIKSAASPPPPSIGSVQGTVKKPDGSAAAGATVELRVGDAVKGNTKTNDKGEYKIEVAVGKYEVVATLPSGTPDKPLTATGNVTVTAGAAQTINLELKPSA
jgi:hypothetical protein